MSLTPQMVEKLEPMSDRVLLEPVEPENITASGIILPSNGANKERPSLYRVIAVGP